MKKLMIGLCAYYSPAATGEGTQALVRNLLYHKLACHATARFVTKRASFWCICPGTGGGVDGHDP